MADTCHTLADRHVTGGAARSARPRRRARRHLAAGLLVVFVASCIHPRGPGQGSSRLHGPAAGATAGAQPMPVGGAGMRVVYQTPWKKPERAQIRSFLLETQLFEQVTATMNRALRLPRPLTVVWTECGAVNASWDGRGNIIMCYELAEHLKALYGKRIANPHELRAATMSAVMFTFLHELGHALAAKHQPRAAGREEDAADQLAALVLIESSKDSVGIAALGAQFVRVLALSGDKTPFFAEHSLDARRYYNVMCLVYGSNPEGFASMVGDRRLPTSRARRCPKEYSKASAAWQRTLDRHTRR